MEEENFEPTLTASSGTSDEGWMAAENVEIAGTEKPELLTPPHSEALEKKPYAGFGSRIHGNTLHNDISASEIFCEIFALVIRAENYYAQIFLAF